MAHLLGKDVALFSLAQAAAGTAASGNFNPRSHYGFSPRRDDPYEDDPIIGQTTENSLDGQAPTDGLVNASFDLDMPLCLNQLGWELPHLMRVVAPAGSDPYTHVFKSGAESHAGQSMAWQEGDEWRLANTVTHSRLELGFTPEAGRRRLRLSGMASDITKPGSDPTGTPATQLALNTIGARSGAIVRKSSVNMADIMGGNFVIERTLTPYRPVGRADGTAESFTPEYGTRISGVLDVRVTGDTLYDFARSRAADDFEFEWEIDSGNMLTLACAALRFTPMERGVSGPGRRTEQYSFQGEVTASAAALEATLINSIASYPGES